MGLAVGVASTAVVALLLLYGGGWLTAPAAPPPGPTPTPAPELEPLVPMLALPDPVPPEFPSRRPVVVETGDPEEPEAWLAHRGPLPATSREGGLSFHVRLQGEPVTCRPELVYRADGGDWKTRRMNRAGDDAWFLTLAGWEIRRLSADVDYWIRCRGTDGAALLSWRSETAPGWFEGGR